MCPIKRLQGSASFPANVSPPFTASLSRVKVSYGSTASLASGKTFHDFRRTAARNMIRAGVPQSIAMRVIGHQTDAMFNRYDITDNRDKLAALLAVRRFVEQQRDEKPSPVRISG
jgi:integrase